jgi:hypothetical protein
MSTQQAIRLAWAAAAVQVGAVALHLGWHGAGGAEPTAPVVHFALLHLPLHLGVVLLGVAVVGLHRRVRPTLPLALLTVAVIVQGVGVVVDIAAVAGGGERHLAARVLAGGGVLALLAAAIGPCRQRLPRTRAPGAASGDRPGRLSRGPAARTSARAGSHPS